jgi:hypothetical protein
MPIKADDVPGLRMYYEGNLVYGVYLLIVFGIIAVAVTLYKLVNPNTTRFEKYLLLVAWAILPPVWFVVEYFFLFLPYGLENSFRYFDYGQNVASKLWGAMSALITLLIYKENGKDKEQKSDKQNAPNQASTD